MAVAGTPAPVPHRGLQRTIGGQPAHWCSWPAAASGRRRGAAMDGGIRRRPAQVQVHKSRAKRLCRRRLQRLCACGRMRLSAYVSRGAGERTVMTAFPLSLAGNEAGGMDCCWLAPVLQMAAVASGNWPLWPEPGPGGWTCFPRIAVRSLGAQPRPVRAARDFTAATLRRWDATERAEDVAVVVSELVTNALRYGLPGSDPARPASRVQFGL